MKRWSWRLSAWKIAKGELEAAINDAGADYQRLQVLVEQLDDS